jgi:hypothetical protein
MEKYGVAGQATDNNTVRCMHLGRWLNKATDTHSEYIKVCFSTARNVTRPSLMLCLYVHCESYYLLKG